MDKQITPTLDSTTEETDPYCLSTERAADMLRNAPWRRFAVVGDSLAAGTGDPSPGYSTVTWSTRLADVLRRSEPRLEYRNLAVIGATASDTRAKQMSQLDDFAPDLLHVACGANDIWRRDPSFVEIKAALRRVFEAAAATGALVTTFTYGRRFTVSTIPGFEDRVCRLNDLIRETALEFHCRVIDCWSHPVNDRADLLSADGIHWSAMGQAVLAAETVKALAETLRGER